MRPTRILTPMTEHVDSVGGREVVDRPEDRGGPMTVDPVEQKPVEAVDGVRAAVTTGGDGREDQEQGGSDEGNPRVAEAGPHVRDEIGALGPNADPVSPSTAVGSSVVISGNLGDTSGSGTRGNDIEVRQTPPRDSAKGKGAVGAEAETTEVTTVEIREVDIAFRPVATAATSSSHVPITKYDVVEHLPDKMLAKLLKDNPVIGEMVLKAKEDRARAIEASEAAKRAGREPGQRGLRRTWRPRRGL
ncbi:hypothetical protein RHMOL_Rhmol04G0197800 [Rhododendron molle]|uniref:Uncharacterized protein n=1 Tax=Rhododendron molle TaxID=49168 RepID=A0ACC0P3F6_RHOML|nr:hypothetical protein RHMOL_Rhmol04G0197800 [Rhododendron molle]